MIRPVSQVSNTLSVIIQVSNTVCVRIQVELSQQQQMVQSKDCNIQEERARQKIYRKGIKGGLDKRNQFPWHEPLLKWMAVHNYQSCICILT